jgi:hypothetical protein
MGGVFNTVNLHVYHYAGNNPVVLVDPDGRDIILLNRSYGALGFGHNAILIGDDENGWVMYSKDGLYENTNRSYATLSDFTRENAAASRKDRYDRATRVSTTQAQDKLMQSYGSTIYGRKYSLWEKIKNGEVKQNCADLVADVISVIGRAVVIGKPKIETGSTQGGYDYGEIMSPIDTKITWPNRQFEDFAKENSGAYTFNLPSNANVL